MTAITYTARTRLISGHTAGNSYSIETEAWNLDPSPAQELYQHKALDGTPETNFVREEEHWSVVTDILTETQKDNWLEFLSSASSNGEAFSFDPYGSIASPDSPMATCYLVPGSWGWSRVAGKQYQVHFTAYRVI